MHRAECSVCKATVGTYGYGNGRPVRLRRHRGLDERVGTLERLFSVCRRLGVQVSINGAGRNLRAEHYEEFLHELREQTGKGSDMEKLIDQALVEAP